MVDQQLKVYAQHVELRCLELGRVKMVPLGYKKTREICKCEDCTSGLCQAAQRSTGVGCQRFNRERLYGDYRTPFAHDRDRIFHCLSFQRLVHKTQVIPVADPAKYTTRLMHSLKVAQIAQTISRALRLNEDLTIAIALGHDLGHAPFGHSGEAILRELLINDGGFEHNEESIFVTVFFDPREPSLNLTLACLEGIVKHTRFDFEPYKKAGIQRQNPWANFRPPGRDLQTYNDPFDYWGGEGPDGKIIFKKPSHYEGQVVDIADEIAYITHDIEDAIAKNIIKRTDPPWEWLRIIGDNPPASIHLMVTDVIKRNARKLMEQPASSRTYKLTIDPEIEQLVSSMKQYFEDRIFRKASRGMPVRNIMEGLFEFFHRNPHIAEKISPFGPKIRLTGFPPKQLAGHILASLTDAEARNAFKKLP